MASVFSTFIGYSDKSLAHAEKLFSEEKYYEALHMLLRMNISDNPEVYFMTGYCFYIKGDPDETVFWYKRAASIGHVQAQLLLGGFYSNGGFVEQDKDEAIIWYTLAAESGNTEAQYSLGMIYFRSETDEKRQHAYIWLQKAAESDHTDAQFRLGECYSRGHGVEQDTALAVFWYREAAQSQHVEAQYRIANCYFYGRGVEEDVVEAINWLTQAAEYGHIKAQYLLGECFYYGYGDQVNKLEAVVCFKKAALTTPNSLSDRSYQANAQYMIGESYYSGYGVPENEADAIEWYTKAAESGHTESQYALGQCYYYGDLTDSIRDQAVFWLTKAAESDHVEAQFLLGEYYRDQGTKSGEVESAIWYSKAANAGHTESQFWLGQCYYNGDGVKQSDADAVHWFEKAVATDHTEAQYQLGRCYFYGHGVSCDESRAVSLYKKAAESFYTEAQYELGRCFYYGIGTDEDKIEALTWLEKAKNSGNQGAAKFLEKPLEPYRPSVSSPFDIVYSTKYSYSNTPAATSTTPTTIPSVVEKSDALDRLNQLIGLSDVKSRVRSLINEIKMRKVREQRGLPTNNTRTYHMIFTGNPGTGKTVVARLVAEILYDLGIIPENKIVETDRSGLVGEYIGHTAVKTMGIIESAIGGVLFIDEAYALKGEGNDFGKEAIEVLLKQMEDRRDEFVVIAAGYTHEMKELMHSNSGLQSRFTRTINFDDYSADELVAIFELMCGESALIIADNARESLANQFEMLKLEKGTRFGNGREVRNIFELVVQNQEERICTSYVDVDQLTNGELQTLTIDDVHALNYA